MNVMPSSAVFGLVTVPPMPDGQDCKGSNHGHHSDLRSAQNGPEDASAPTASPRGKWGRAMRGLSLVLNGLFAIALTAGPAAGSHRTLGEPAPIPALTRHLNDGNAALTKWGDARLLQPVTFGMRPPQATKVALMAPPDLKSDTGPFKPTEVEIDVIVAYTQKAARNYSDIERELVEHAIEEANRSFRDSNLGHIKLRLVHAYQTDYVEEGSHFEHVWRFADRGDGYMDEIHALRDQYRADVAILVVDDAQGCGLATRVHADADDAFAVVHHECAAANYTLAHEIGHLIGARHELGYVNGTKWRDIMSYKGACGGCPRVAVWSNPTVLVDGEPAGTAELNNARVIADGAQRVAAFR